MAIEISPEQREIIIRRLLLKFDKVLRMNANGTGTPAWKSIFFLLDHLSRGDFYGTIQMKVLGCVVKDPRIVERTFKVEEMYRDIEHGHDRPLTESEQHTLDSISATMVEILAGDEEGS